MSWFRRDRKKDDESWGDDEDVATAPSSRSGAAGSDDGSGPDAGAGSAADAGAGSAADAGAEDERSGTDDDASPASGALYDRSAGPWDQGEADTGEGAYIDLGALWLPATEGTLEMRLEVEEETGRVIAVTVQLDDSAVQLQTFAAPRTRGIWDDIRAEIAASVSRQGGTADEVQGVFGRELIARVPARTPEGRTVLQPARFTGVDGPRWFLRAVFHGSAAYDTGKAAGLERLVRDIVVVRGSEAMAPRELLALRLPENAQPEDGPDGADGSQPAGSALRPPERGPEVTELR